MHNSRISQISGLSIAAALALVLTAGLAGADQAARPLFGDARPGVFPLSATVTNGNVTFSWPHAPGKWELFQQPAASSEWKSVAAAQYQTNSSIVTVTLPLAKQTVYYCVRPTVEMRPPPLPNLPPVPPPPTNRPPPRFKQQP